VRKKEIDWSKLDGMLLFDANKPTCALELGISDDTIDRGIKKKFNMTFTEYKSLQLGKTVLRLKQKMIKKALEGDNTCLIFSLKNISDWKDQPDKEIDKSDKAILVKYSLEHQDVGHS
jgi:hypothetical protein